MAEYHEQVDALLAKYAEYKQLLQKEADISMRVAKQKILSVVDAALLEHHTQIRQALQTVSDSMTFADPFVWIMYKFEAYKNEAQPIRTMRDFRIHCSKEGDICSKRFAFVNEQLLLHRHPPLADTGYYREDVLIDTLLKQEGMQVLIHDPSFMDLWDSYEFHQKKGVSAKWQNYLIAI